RKVRYQGQDYFIRGRISTGSAIFMTSAGNKVDLKPIPKFEKMRSWKKRPFWSDGYFCCTIGNAS
ncbi:MAG TPA: HNH endonuclease, partial [Ktedonobacteraceae bacterium]|nr:HNH endonuclease [Ktedonobacteraceae bacterium]